MPYTAYIVDAIRTPVGKKNGLLAKWHPADLGAVVVDELVKRTGIPPEAVDDVIFGCVSQVGAQSANLARNVVLSSKLPESVPGTTVDRQCGSSQQAIHFAAQAVMSGVQNMVIAGGVEIMSAIPIGSGVADGIAAGHGHPFASEGIEKRYNGANMSQFEGAELVAKKFGITRKEMEELAFHSHRRGHEATQSGRFKPEIVPVKGTDSSDKEVLMTADEGIRWPADLAKMAQLKTLKEGGVITAALSSQISDGAAALLIVNEVALKKYNLKPRAKIISLALAGDDPIMMLSAPIPAARTALQRAGLTINDMEIYEVNEAFASVPLAFVKELKGDLSKLNVNGGAMALGHPLGATGAKLMTTMLYELERRKGKYAIQAICEGGGTANATIIERIESTGAKL